MRHGHGQALLIGAGELLGFAVLPTMPDRTHRMDDVAGGQLARAL